MATISEDLWKVLRVRVGLLPDDESKDAQIQTVYDVAFEWLEGYLDRFLEPGTYKEKFTHYYTGVLSLKGYPVVSIESLEQEDPNFSYTLPTFHLENMNGLMHFDGVILVHKLEVTYICAPVINGAMTLALMAMFDTSWRTFSATSEETPTGAIRSIAIDGMRTEYDTGQSSGSSGGGVDPETGLPETITGILNPYRRVRV